MELDSSLKDNNVTMDSGVGTPLEALDHQLKALPFEEEEEEQHRDTTQAHGTLETFYT